MLGEPSLKSHILYLSLVWAIGAHYGYAPTAVGAYAFTAIILTEVVDDG